MADSKNRLQSEDQTPTRGDRRFAVSANRDKASHRLRYVEAGGAAVDTEECTFCQSVPELFKGEEN